MPGWNKWSKEMRREVRRNRGYQRLNQEREIGASN